MHQYVYERTISGTDYYVWMDGDGTEHYFPQSGSAPYEDAEGMSLKLQPYSTYYVITDKGNTQMRFNIVSGREKAWLAAVRDSMENTAQVSYNAAEGQIAKITDPAGRETNFYYTNNLLSSITTPGGGERHGAHGVFHLRHGVWVPDGHPVQRAGRHSGAHAVYVQLPQPAAGPGV